MKQGRRKRKASLKFRTKLKSCYITWGRVPSLIIERKQLGTFFHKKIGEGWRKEEASISNF